MALTKCCFKSFDSAARSVGAAYFYGRCVEITIRGPHGVSALVTRHGAQPYEVELDWQRVDECILDAYCSCPRYAAGELCRHIWAVVLAADRQRLTPDPPNPANFVVLHANEDDGEGGDDGDDSVWGDTDWGQSRASHNRRMSPARGGRDQQVGARQAAWKRLLNAAGGGDRSGMPLALTDPHRPASIDLGGQLNEAWFLLNAAASREAGGLVVDFYHREPRKNGGFGKIKRLAVRRTDRLVNFSQADRELIQQLLGNALQHEARYGAFGSYYGRSFDSLESYNRCQIATAMHGVLLPRLCATQRLVWLANAEEPLETGRPIVWDDGLPWQFRLAIEPDERQRRWTVQGQLYRDQQVVPLSDAVLLISSGLVLFPSALAGLVHDDDFSWIVTFRQHPTVSIPYADRAHFLEYLSSLPHLPTIDMPANLRVEQVHPEPRGKLSIRAPQRYASNRYLAGVVSFCYDDRTVSLRDPHSAWFDAEKNQFILRSPEKEQALLGQLRAIGLEHQPPSRHHGEQVDVRLLAKQLPHVVEQLTADGWQVESEGRLIRRPGRVTLSVASGIDWFELDGKVDFDGVTASLPTLLKALRNNEKYIRLDDGTHGMLPAEWLKQYGSLADLGQARDGKLKFRSSQALLLDALLAAQDDVQVDERFDEYRRRLRSFEGVQAADAPRGFVGALRPYQQEGLGWLNFLREFRLGGCLADDMGLGKTVQVLAMLEARRAQALADGQARKPSLVVVPKSLVFNWIDEAARFAPRLRVLNYAGLDRVSLREQFADYDVILATYGILRRDIVELRSVPFDYAILDESQAIKNAHSQAAKASRLVQAEHRLAMTGTPIENHLGELWSLFEFLNPGMLGRSRTFAALTKGGRKDGDADSSLPLLASALRPFMLRRTKEQVLSELPEKTEQTLFCEMPPKQRKLYDELREFYRTSLNQRVSELGFNKAKIHVLEALLRLRQAACHPGLVDPKRATEPSAKLELLTERISETVAEGHKALIFSQFTSLLTLVRQQFDAQGLTYEYLDGQTQDRGAKVKRFQQDADCPLFLISLKAGGHGLNLTAADYVYILDPWWNPAAEAQAVDRAHRIGQLRHVFAYRLICRDTVEEKIVELQREKRELADAIIAADGNVIGNLTAEDLQLLLS